VVLVERALEDLPLARELFQTLEYLVERGAAEQYEERGAAGFERGGDLFHHLVVDADDGVLRGDRARRYSDRSAEQGIQKQEADEHAPEASADRAGGREAHSLIELDLAFLIARHDDGVFEIDQILLLHLE